MLDEQSFQDMLAAAFTIQEHNAQRKRLLQVPVRTCPQCGSSDLRDEARLCPRCADEPPRQGEELQRKWASLWLMSQEQGLGPDSFSTSGDKLDERPFARHEAVAETGAATADLPGHHFSEAIEFPESIEIPLQSEGDRIDSEMRLARADSSIAVAGIAVAGDEAGLPEMTADLDSDALETVDAAASAPSLRDLRLKLRFHRADFYLVVAIAVSTFAMVWVLSATPAPGAHRKPRLRPWERALITMGLAEAPEPPPRRGNPNISVWADPKTALYYCVGEELYGKAPGGHLATQREAQLDQFEPAGRTACE
jgi:hypothetical protein